MPDHVDLVQTRLDKLGERIEEHGQSIKDVDARVRLIDVTLARVHTTQKITAWAVGILLPFVIAPLLTAIVAFSYESREKATRAEARAELAGQWNPTAAVISSRPYRHEGALRVDVQSLAPGLTQTVYVVEVSNRKEFEGQLRQAIVKLGGKAAAAPAVLTNHGMSIDRNADVWPECSYCLYGPIGPLQDLEIELPVVEQLHLTTPEFQFGVTLQGLAAFVNRPRSLAGESKIPDPSIYAIPPNLSQPIPDSDLVPFESP